MKNKIRIWDFDGCLMNTPMPDTGRIIWKEKTGKEYPHVGWWGRLESMNDDVFDIQPRWDVLDIFNSDTNTINFILTSRLPRFTDLIWNLVDKHNLDITDVFTKTNAEKGERIFEILSTIDTTNINIVEFYDDRDKEIISANEWKENIESTYNVQLKITQV